MKHIDWKLLFYKIKRDFFPRLIKNHEFKYILEAQGISVGKGTVFFDSKTMQIDRSRPYLLRIGEYCKITAGVTILTHDYSRSVLRRVYGEVVGDGAETVIGNNVFIGMNSIILMGTNIGDNVIVGAGSVVSGTIPDNVVVAGNPARIIRTLDEHYKIWKDKSLVRACKCFWKFYHAYGRYPLEAEMDPFWFLWMERDKDKVITSGVKLDLSGDEYDEVVNSFMHSKPVFESGYDGFVEFCEKHGEDYLK